MKKKALAFLLAAAMLLALSACGGKSGGRSAQYPFVQISWRSKTKPPARADDEYFKWRQACDEHG